MDISAEFEMDPQHGPSIRVTADGTAVAVYLALETGTVTPPPPSRPYGIEVKGPWWKFRQYIETPTLPEETVDLKLLMEARNRIAELEAALLRLGADYGQLKAKNQRYLKALYNIIDAWDGHDDSMGSDPAEIARNALDAERE